MNPVLNWGNEEEGYGGGSAATSAGQASPSPSGAVASASASPSEKKSWKSWWSKSSEDKAAQQGSTPNVFSTAVSAPAAVSYDINANNNKNASADTESDRKKPWYMRTTKKSQDLTLLIACIFLVVLLNIPLGRYILYPF